MPSLAQLQALLPELLACSALLGSVHPRTWLAHLTRQFSPGTHTQHLHRLGLAPRASCQGKGRLSFLTLEELLTAQQLSLSPGGLDIPP